ncbi:uncharacterized protein LOC131231104 [Magnolia sinica]|uniref:uncharacterized protein LOC131231104 n=1 Tax=Magnolia sinica TaxID=86752 RepID=UPI00265A2869|nr:uncharacterized protein LOC131231104 [Magnolia sinica]
MDEFKVSTSQLEIDGADPDVRRSYPDVERGSLEGGKRCYDYDEAVHFLWTTLEWLGHLDRPCFCICSKLMDQTQMCVGAIRMLSRSPWKVRTAVMTMMKLSISYGQH